MAKLVRDAPIVFYWSMADQGWVGFHSLFMLINAEITVVILKRFQAA
jgi:hypothetical protein